MCRSTLPRRGERRRGSHDTTTPTHDGDAQLIQACLNGDQVAWNALVERYGRLVYSVAVRCKLSAADADDVFQTVFGIVLRRLETLRDQSRISPWLVRTTYRECWRIGRARRRTTTLEESVADDGTPSDEQVAHDERQDLVRQGLVKLDEKCRELLTALFLTSDKPDYEGVARTLGMRIGSIGPTRARCFAKMQKILAELGLSG